MISEKEAVDIKGKMKVDDDGDGSTVVVVVLMAVIHCDGCARKLKRSLLKHLDGAEKVKVNYESKKVTVRGKVDPAKVKERVEVKTKKPAYLLSPIPKPDANPVHVKPPVHSNKSEDVVTDQIKPRVLEVPDKEVIYVLKTRVHCDKCVHKINKIIKKYQGVEDVNVDIEKDRITVKGKMDMKEMIPYLNTKLKRVVKIIQPPADSSYDGGQKKKYEDKCKTDCEEKIIEKEDEQKPKTSKTVRIDGSEGSIKKVEEKVTAKRVEVVKKMEYNGGNGYEYGTHMYDPQQVQVHGKGYVVEHWNGPGYSEAPTPYYNFQEPLMFSDENPNAACSIM